MRTHYIFQDTGEPFSRRFTEWNSSAFERVNSPPEGDREHDSSGLMGPKGGHYPITYMIFFFLVSKLTFSDLFT